MSGRFTRRRGTAPGADRRSPFLTGQVTVRLEGPTVSQALSQALGRGVPVFAIRPITDRELEVVVAASDLRGFRRALRGRRVRMRVVGRRGLPYAIYAAARRPGLWIGGLVFVGGLGWASTQVWAVRVEGTRPRLGQAVIVEARRLGLHPGVPRTAVDRRSLPSLLERRVKGLSWVGVVLDGGLVVIHAVPEGTVTTPASEQAGTLVAWHGGVVRRLILTQGTADVRVGDTVRAGQILAQGYTVQGSTLRGGEPGPIHFIAPRGIVVAEFTATGEASVPARRTERRIGQWLPTWRLSLGTHVVTQRSLPETHGRTVRFEGHPLLDVRIPLPLVGPLTATVLGVRSVDVREAEIPSRTLVPKTTRLAQARIEHETGAGARVMGETRRVWRNDGRLFVRLTDRVEVNVARPGARKGGSE